MAVNNIGRGTESVISDLFKHVNMQS